MIAVAHHFSDSGQRGIEHFAAQIHCDLAREYDFAAPLAADNVGRRNIEVICNGVDDKFRRDHLLLVRGDDVAQHLLCKINVDFTFFKVCVCNDFVESAFQFTDVRFNIGSDVFDHIVADGIAV